GDVAGCGNVEVPTTRGQSENRPLAVAVTGDVRAAARALAKLDGRVRDQLPGGLVDDDAGEAVVAAPVFAGGQCSGEAEDRRRECKCLLQNQPPEIHGPFVSCRLSKKKPPGEIPPAA